MPGQISNASSAVGNVSLLNGHTQLAGITTIYDAAFAIDTTAPLYTVTAGKTFYLIHAYIACYSTVDLQEGSLKTSFPGTLLWWRSAITGTYKTSDAATIQITPPQPMPFPANTAFTLYSSHADMDVRGAIWGFEI